MMSSNLGYQVLLTLLLVFIAISESARFHAGRPVKRHGLLGLPRVLKHPQRLNESWFEQKLDHFEPTDNRTWKQRYWMNFEYFDSKSGNAPVFLQLGGEGEADPIWLKEGQAAKNFAKHFNALGILLEHRYYGKSHPTNDMSTPNLKYLTSEQALQDTAKFIGFIRKKYNLTGENRWIVFGGSYPGSLAAWFRLKYPHLVAGAVASSAPVQAVLNFKEYIQVVENSLGAECVKQIKLATDDLTERLKSPEQWKEIQKKFRLCDPLEDAHDKLDIQNLMSTLAGNFENVVQYNKDNREFEGAKATNITIDVVCGIMTGEHSTGTPFDRMAAVNNLLLNAYLDPCLDYKYENMIAMMNETSFEKSGPGSALRLWTYQTCTEFGFYQTSDLPGQPFGQYFPLDYFVQQCVDAFGPQFKESFIQKGIDFTNSFYGGFNLTLTNVLFPNGLIDPWHALGVLKEINPTAQPLIIEETAHCADMYPDSKDDPESLRKARQTIRDTIGKFLASH